MTDHSSGTTPILSSRLSLGTQIGWGIADAGINVFVLLKSVMIINFMTSYLGISATLAGVITGLVVLTDMVTDPLVGVWSDRTDTRWGRRRPFMVVGVILMLILTYLTFAVPAGLSGALAGVWVFVFYGLASIGFTMVAVPYGSMTAEMTPNRQERVTLTGFRMAFASVGLLLSGLVFAPQTRADFAGGAWVLTGVIMVLPVLVTVLTTSKAPRVSATGVITQKGRQIGRFAQSGNAFFVAEQIAVVFRSRSFLRHLAAYAIMTLAVAIISAGIRYITDDLMAGKAGSGDFDSFLSAIELDQEQRIKLGLSPQRDSDGAIVGWINRAGLVSDQPGVVLDLTQPGFDFNAIDFESLADHPYGPEQVGAMKDLLNQAIAAQLVPPLALLVNMVGVFSAIFALFLVGSILSQLLLVPLAQAIGRDRTLVLGTMAYSAILVGYLFVLRSDNLNLIIATPFFLGMCNGCYQNLPWAILPTMIDNANQTEGRRVEGAFNGFWLSGQKIAHAIGPLIFVILLECGGFLSSRIGFRIQNEAASQNMEMLMTILPAVFLLAAIPFFLSVEKSLRR